MDLFIKFAVDNYVLIIMFVGMFILTAFDVFLERKMIIRLRATLIILLSLVAADSFEYLAAQFDHPTLLRVIMSAIGYSLRPIIILMLIMLIYKKAHWRLAIPAIINSLVAFSAFFTDIAYWFDENNIFHRGFLGYTPYIVSLFYILYLFFLSIRVFSKDSSLDGFIVMFIAVTASVSALFAISGYDDVVNQTFAAEILMYYLYVYGQYTRRDALTGLFNRQSFYSDTKKYSSAISGMISIDMNELKWMNDTLGHDAGDKALKAVTEGFLKAATAKERIYRIGGDEFIVICRERTAEEMVKLVDDMRASVDATGYSCAFGLSVDGTPEEMIKEADERMYADKARIKGDVLAKGGMLHLRD